MNDLSSAWHCNACARLHLFRDPSPKPARCEDCGSPVLFDAGPTSGFGDLNVIEAPDTGPTRLLGAGQGSADAMPLIAEARRLRDQARVVSVSLGKVIVATASVCAASRRARADRVDSRRGPGKTVSR